MLRGGGILPRPLSRLLVVCRKVDSLSSSRDFEERFQSLVKVAIFLGQCINCFASLVNLIRAFLTISTPQIYACGVSKSPRNLAVRGC